MTNAKTRIIELEKRGEGKQEIKVVYEDMDQPGLFKVDGELLTRQQVEQKYSDGAGEIILLLVVYDKAPIKNQSAGRLDGK